MCVCVYVGTNAIYIYRSLSLYIHIHVKMYISTHVYVYMFACTYVQLYRTGEREQIKELAFARANIELAQHFKSINLYFQP